MGGDKQRYGMRSITSKEHKPKSSFLLHKDIFQINLCNLAPGANSIVCIGENQRRTNFG